MPITEKPAYLSRQLVRFALVGGLAFIALMVAILGGKPSVAEAAQAKCPQFRVVHNDRIGNVKFPAGYYNVTVLNSSKLSCASTTKLMQEFLQDWDGRLRAPWRLTQNGERRIFRAGNSDRGFFVVPASKSGGGGGNSGRSCPRYFTVKYRDSIGSLKIPRGKYRLTLLDDRKLNCAQAARLFRKFLLDFDGRLPRPWKVNPLLGIFYKSTAGRTGFKVNRAYDPSPSPKPDRRYIRCPGTFQVMHNDRIGALYLRKGPYYTYVLNGLTCARATTLFKRFLKQPDGRLPGRWRINVPQAKFNTGAGGPAFRVQHA